MLLLPVWASLGFVMMEPMAWLTHRYVMHGPLWCWHRSHHEPHESLLERNDRFALIFAGVATAFILAGGELGQTWATAFGVGVVAYGVAYAALHDCLVHRRWGPRLAIRRGYLARLIAAHHLHHARAGREGGVSFGFLYAPPVAHLRRRLAGQSRAG